MRKADLQPNMWSYAGRVIKSVPFLGKAVMSQVRKLRIQRAKDILEGANLFPESIDQILADYSYAISRTYRNVMQVINLESVLRYIEESSIEGAFVETGTYTGGASAYALLALQRLRKNGPARAYWGFDSFEGMPCPGKDDGEKASYWILGKPFEIEESNVLRGHEINRADYSECLSYLQGTGYPAELIHLVKGWFQNTLSQSRTAIGQIAVLRLDGDLYESTKVALDQLYDQVVYGGVVIIDDYGSFEGCRKAIEDLFSVRGFRPHLYYVEHGIRYFIRVDNH